jgi:hypothetical protein
MSHWSAGVRGGRPTGKRKTINLVWKKDRKMRVTAETEDGKLMKG